MSPPRLPGRSWGWLLAASGLFRAAERAVGCRCRAEPPQPCLAGDGGAEARWDRAWAGVAGPVSVFGFWKTLLVREKSWKRSGNSSGSSAVGAAVCGL